MLNPNLGITMPNKFQKHNHLLQNNKTVLTIHPDKKREEGINIIKTFIDLKRVSNENELKDEQGISHRKR